MIVIVKKIKCKNNSIQLLTCIMIMHYKERQIKNNDDDDRSYGHGILSSPAANIAIINNGYTLCSVHDFFPILNRGENKKICPVRSFVCMFCKLCFIFYTINKCIHKLMSMIICLPRPKNSTTKIEF